MASPPEGAQRARKPMYEDEHSSCSVLLAKIRNEDHLLALSPHDQFRWLHRFYLALDRIAEQHRVYKLYGGPHGFMISAGVAEPDADHAATLLRFSLHVLQATQNIKLPGLVPLDLVLVLASGAASSGLLGTTSLTYQIVGRVVTVARELMETQRELPFLVTGGMLAELKPVVRGELALLGSVQLRCCPGEVEAVYSLPRFRGVQLDQPAGIGALEERPAGAPMAAIAEGCPAAAVAATPARVQQLAVDPAVAASAAAKEASLAADAAGGPAAAEGPSTNPGLDTSAPSSIAALPHRQQAAAGAPAGKPGIDLKRRAVQQIKEQLGGLAADKSMGTLPRNTHSGADSWLQRCDLLMRFEEPRTEAEFARFNNECQEQSESAWLLLGLFTAILYSFASLGRGDAIPGLRLMQFQLVPAVAELVRRCDREAFLRYREALWFLQRLLVLAATSFPGSFVFGSITAMPVFAFGMCNLALESVTRRLRLHLQLLCSLMTYAASLSLMGLHPDGSPVRTLITPAFLSLHLLVTAVAPACIAAACDYVTRCTFYTRLAAQQAVAAEENAQQAASAQQLQPQSQPSAVPRPQPPQQRKLSAL